MDLYDLVHGGGDAGRRTEGAPRPPATTAEELTAGLNPEQRKAVLHESGPLLILAGAGSGKTRAITHRIAYLVRVRGVPASAILAITFTNKAADEMRSRVDALVGPVSGYMWVGTFHAMMMRILRRHIDRLGFDRSFTVVDTDDQHRTVRACIADLGLDEKQFQVRSVHAAISRAKNDLQGVEEFEALAGGDWRQQKIAAVYREYQARLRRSGTLDFDDILLYAVELFERFPDVLSTYQDRFRHVLVDEYQDTNRVQYLIVRMLSAKHGNLCVVGDDDQSIYAFRGATVRNILDFEKDFPSCAVIKLEQNYRSTRAILDAANHVIAHNRGRKAKKLWTDVGEGEKVVLMLPADQEAEAFGVADRIQELTHRAGAARQEHREIAILYRLNALSRNFEEALNNARIPYRIYGGTRFYDRREVKDCIAYLNLIANGNADVAFERIVNVPRRGIGDATLSALVQAAGSRGLSRLDACACASEEPTLSRAAGRLGAFRGLILRFRERLAGNAAGLSDFIESVQNESGQIQELVDQNDEEGRDRLENLKELLSSAVLYERAVEEKRAALERGLPEGLHADDRDPPPADLAGMLLGFLEQVALYSDTDAMDETKDFVRLMTVHSAKGLEFRTVFLVGAEEGLFPGFRAIDSEDELEEERRLMYVAITRAKETLYVSAAKSRLMYGQTRGAMPSRFVREIPEEMLEVVEPGARRRSLLFERSGPAPWRDPDRVRYERSPGTAYGAPSGAGGGSGAGFGRPAAPMPGPGVRAFAPSKPAAPPPVAAKVPGALGADEIEKGARVLHARFGPGTVKQKEPVAGDAILVIEFDGAGTKRLMARQANLLRET